jgi:hypothetical protein
VIKILFLSVIGETNALLLHLFMIRLLLTALFVNPS